MARLHRPARYARAVPDDDSRRPERVVTHTQTALGHALAAATVVGTTIVLTMLAYFGMLAWAVLMGEPIGGALALPFMLLLALVGSAASVILVLFPSTLLTHGARQRLNWPLITEIPIAVVMSFAVSVLVGVVAGALLGTVEDGVRLALAATALLLVPLGLYWWSLQGTTWLLRTLRAAWRWLVARHRAAA